MMKKIFFLSLFLLSFCLTQQSLYAESITLTTYYPAPFGAYDRLRLVPRAPLAGACDPGTIYVDTTTNQMQFCQSDQTWGSVAGVWVKKDNDIYPADTSFNPNLNVGIGVIKPAAKLHIQGKGTTQATYSLGVTDSANKPLFVVRDDGLIGIGTTHPNTRLDVKGAGATSATYGFGVRNSTNQYSFVVRDDSTVGIGTVSPQAKLYVKGSGNTSGTSSLNVTDNSGRSTLFVRDDGQVGIKTTSPDTQLHVQGCLKIVDGSQAAGKVLTSDATGKASWQTVYAVYAP